MKSINIFLGLLFSATILFGQNVYIPDENFKNKLIEIGVDTNNDGEISIQEAVAQTGTLQLAGSGIKDLTGIEAFEYISKLYVNNNELDTLILDHHNLWNINCSNNNLVLVDLYKCSTLLYVNCNNNEIRKFLLPTYETIINLSCNFNQIDTLILDGFLSLENLNCENNSMKYVKIANCTYWGGHGWVDNINFKNSIIERFEISDFLEIKNLDFEHSNISEIKFNNIQLIDNLNFSYSNLHNLDLSGVLNVDELDISENPDFEYMCLGILPAPFTIIAYNTPDYITYTCGPENGNIFTSGQLSNTFNYQYGYPPQIYDSIDINGDNISDIHRWFYLTGDPNGNYTKNFYLRGINNTTLLYSSGIYQTEPFADIANANDWRWRSDTIHTMTYWVWENGGNITDEISRYKYFACRSIQNIDTIFSWFRLDKNSSDFFDFKEFNSWKPCYNTLNLGEDKTITTNDSFILSSDKVFDNYFWMTGDTTQSIFISGEELGIGTHEYILLATSGACNYEDTIQIKVTEAQGVYELATNPFIIYPNPATDILYIESTGNHNHDIKLEILDLTGRNILQKSRMFNNEAKFDLKVNNLPRGVYFLKIFGKQSFTKKLILK